MPAMFLDIERAAKLTIRETDDRGLRLVQWEPFSADQAPNAALSSRVESRTADRELAATLAWVRTSGRSTGDFQSRCNSDCPSPFEARLGSRAQCTR